MGATTINGRLDSPYCSTGTSGPVTVQKPTALRVVQTVVDQARTDCLPGSAGWRRVVNRRVIDQNGHDIMVAKQTVNETVTLNPGQAGLGSGPITQGPGITDANGQYPDSFAICSNLCPASTATNTATQTNTDILPGGGSYALSNSTIQYACKWIKINGSLTP